MRCLRPAYRTRLRRPFNGVSVRPVLLLSRFLPPRSRMPPATASNASWACSTAPYSRAPVDSGCGRRLEPLMRGDAPTRTPPDPFPRQRSIFPSGGYRGSYNSDCCSCKELSAERRSRNRSRDDEQQSRNRAGDTRISLKLLCICHGFRLSSVGSEERGRPEVETPEVETNDSPIKTAGSRDEQNQIR
jgi:hypothetical protein